MGLVLQHDIIINEHKQLYDIGNGTSLFTCIINENRVGKTAIFIHGGGSGGNHTMLLRPAKWMIEKGLFSKIILPDRRGEGLSTPLTSKLSIREHALDMKALLDKLNTDESITAIGLSYGGPIAMELAGMDSRIKEIILMASSPSLRKVKGLRGFLYKHKLLEPFVKSFYKKNLGTLPAIYPDYEKVYDLNSDKELTNFFVKAIKHTNKSMYDSLMLQNASTLDQNNSAISSNINLDIPIYQIIGSRDEIWETDISSYLSRFVNLQSYLVEGEKHKGVILKADKYYQGLLTIYNK